jgi:two-component system sensor histidine kinase VicK
VGGYCSLLKGDEMSSKAEVISTRVVYGIQNVLDTETDLFYRAKERIDTCMNYTRPPLAITLPQIMTAFLDAKKRGVKLRYITEITEDNISYCKELIPLVHELRHLDSIRNNFMMSEKEYLAPLVLDDRETISSELVYSNLTQVVQQGQNTFDLLWEKAILAEQKIKEIEERKVKSKTEVLHGAENALARGAKFMQNVQEKMDICFDSRGASVVTEVDTYKNGYAEIRKRGGKIRAFTEITKDNISYCKELMKLVNELRHFDGIKGGIAVSETEYMATTVLQEAKPLPEVIYSNVKEIVEQGQYIFDTLWSKTTSAEQKIREIEDGIIPYETKIIDNPDEIVKQIIHLAEISAGISILSNYGGMQLIHNNFLDLYKKLLERQKEGKGRGIKWVMTIEKESIEMVKMFLKLGMKIRHVKHLTPINFAVSEHHLNATMEQMHGGKMIKNLLTSNEPVYIKLFTSMFKQLWRDGLDAEYRIKDLEEGIAEAEIEIIQNPVHVIDRSWEAIESASNGIDSLFASANALKRQIAMGVFDVLKEASKLRKVRIRLLVPSSPDIHELIQEVKSTIPKIDIRILDASLETRITILVADKKKCLVVELKDDAQNSSYGAVGLSTYSESPSIVSSYSSIFESFWRQAELVEKLKQIETLERDFVNIAAHELRTPIQPIIGFSELLYAKIKNKGERKLLEAIMKNARRLEKLAAVMLDVTRIEKNSLVLKKESFDMGQIIADLGEQYNDQLGKMKEQRVEEGEDGNGDVKISWELTEHVKVYADKMKMIQVISNLLDNAIKFTSEGYVYVSLKKRVEGGQTSIVVSVKDEGSGMDVELLPHLFTKFVSRSEVGTGLGLFISKGIVEAHGGKIWAKNNLDGRGATFAFTIPISNDDHSK